MQQEQAGMRHKDRVLGDKRSTVVPFAIILLFHVCCKPKTRQIVALAAQALAPAWPFGVVVGAFVAIHLQQTKDANRRANEEELEHDAMLELTCVEPPAGEEHFDNEHADNVISYPLMLEWAEHEEQPASEPAAAETEDCPATPAAPADLAEPNLVASTIEQTRRLNILVAEFEHRFSAALGHYQADMQQVLIGRPEGTAESLCRHLVNLSAPGLAQMGERLDGRPESGSDVMALAVGVLVEVLKRKLEEWRLQQEAKFRLDDRREYECAKLAGVLHQEIEHVMRYLPIFEEEEETRRRRKMPSV